MDGHAITLHTHRLGNISPVVPYSSIYEKYDTHHGQVPGMEEDNKTEHKE